MRYVGNFNGDMVDVGSFNINRYIYKVVLGGFEWFSLKMSVLVGSYKRYVILV